MTAQEKFENALRAAGVPFAGSYVLKDTEAVRPEWATVTFTHTGSGKRIRVDPIPPATTHAPAVATQINTLLQAWDGKGTQVPSAATLLSRYQALTTGQRAALDAGACVFLAMIFPAYREWAKNAVPTWISEDPEP